MTSEEIKQNTSMHEVVKSYGIYINRANKCLCPFHKDSHPSMHIYKDSYFCFTCHESGDIFTFVQKMDNCDFPTAYLKLGGAYEHKDISNKERMLELIKRDQKKRKEEEERNKEKALKQTMAFNLEAVRTIISTHKPMTDEWCFAQELLPIVQEHWETYYIRKEDLIINDVLRINRRIRKRFPSLR